MIRKATVDDLYPLCDMARRFVEETNLPYTFDEELTKKTFWEAIQGDSILLVYVVDGVLAGAVMGYEDRDFCKESSAYITKLYIEKEFRGLSVSRELVKAFENAVTSKIIFTSATAGMGERVEKLYVHLFERAGYTVLGRVLVKL